VLVFLLGNAAGDGSAMHDKYLTPPRAQQKEYIHIAVS